MATDHFDDRYNPPAGLDEDDDEGRRLAGAAVAAADRAIRRESADNLAFFVRACGLHWLGDREGAAAGYREALRLDPFDDLARARVEEFEDTVLPEPAGALASRLPYSFHLLEMTHVVAHSGSMNGRAWLLNDPADVRHAADDYLDQWLKLEDQSLDQDFGIWTQLVDGQGAGADLRPLLEHTPAAGSRSTSTADGSPRIDWSRVPLPDLGAGRLPAGHPIRLHGRIHFFGTTEYDD